MTSYEALSDSNEGIEAIIDAVLNQFDDNFTLAGAANATVLPVEVWPCRSRPGRSRSFALW